MSEHDEEYDGGWPSDALAPAPVRPDTGRTTGEDALGLFRTVLVVQAGWMALVLGLLFGLDSLTLESFFVLSFLGLLGVRLLFAPTRGTPGWWRVLRWVVYLGFVVLGYVFFRDLSVFAA
jgi:hypothetical protein